MLFVLINLLFGMANSMWHMFLRLPLHLRGDTILTFLVFNIYHEMYIKD